MVACVIAAPKASDVAAAAAAAVVVVVAAAAAVALETMFATFPVRLSAIAINGAPFGFITCTANNAILLITPNGVTLLCPIFSFWFLIH